MGAVDGRADAGRGLYLKLFLLSAGLFCVEMTAIRLVSTEIRVFAYFKNLALLACFFGMGLGCLPGRLRRIPLAATYPLLTVFTLAIILPRHFDYDPYASITQFLGRFNEMAVWGASGAVTELGPALLALLALAAILAFIALLFLPGGALLASLFEENPHRLAAYSVNILGSLAGIWIFTGLSAVSTPPLMWMLLSFVLLAPLLATGRERITALVCGALLAGTWLALPEGAEKVYWTPYQKIAVAPMTIRTPDGAEFPGGTLLRVNDTFYQRVVDLSPAYLAAHMNAWPEAGNIDYMSYNLAYRVKPTPENVLVVGAGTGNDVAAALRNGAKHVDAVEIDPVIVEMGRLHHPERPYDDPRVAVHVDDARSWFKKAKVRYDLIVFGALDSHTLSSTLSNIQIDNYVYTVEAFTEARALLKSDGLLCVVFSAAKPFIGARLKGMLTEAFGREPYIFQNEEIKALFGAGGGLTFYAENGGVLAAAAKADPKTAAALARAKLEITGEVTTGTDDWPYLYLKDRQIPKPHLIVMGILLLLGVLAVRAALGTVGGIDPFYFLTGAAFILVEVQTISRMALLFGTTWLVNSVAISAVLLMILAANYAVRRWPGARLAPVYAALAASLAANWFFPDAIFLTLSPLARAAASGFVMGLPIFFSGIIFARLFAKAAQPGHALASNLLGTLVGGALESVSFLTGIRSLGLLALGLYALSGAVLARRAAE